MIVTGSGFSFRPNVNPCSDCGERVLPEPIVFAKLCRVTGMYVCNPCYIENQESAAASLPNTVSGRHEEVS